MGREHGRDWGVKKDVKEDFLFLSFLTSLTKVHTNFFFFPKAAPAAYGGSQARGLIGAVAASLCQRHSNVRSKLHLRSTPQLTATPDP